MRVLITGHLRFIGAVTVLLVQKAGHEVIGFYDGCDFDPRYALAADRSRRRHLPRLRRRVRGVA